jgi:PAS domain S-box-containing protein
MNEGNQKPMLDVDAENLKLQLQVLFKLAPIGFSLLRGPQYIVEVANEQILEIWGKTMEEVMDKPVFEAVPEATSQGFENLLKQVYDTGKPFTANEIPIQLQRKGQLADLFLKVVYEAFRNDSGEIAGILVITQDITPQVRARKKSEASEAKFRNYIHTSPVPVAIFTGPEFIIEMANREMFEKIWRKTEVEVLGQKAFDVFPELREQKYAEILTQVYTSGQSHSEKESLALVMGDDGMKEFYLDFEYLPLFESNEQISGLMITVRDVTDKVMAKKAIEESNVRQKLAIEAVGIGTFEWDMVQNTFIYSERLAHMFGYSETEGLLQTSFSNRILETDRHIRLEAHAQANQTGALFYESRFMWPDGSIHWIRLNGKIMFDDQQKPLKMYGTTLDITDQKRISEELERKVEERTLSLQLKNEELKQSEERYHKMTEEIQDYAIIMLDVNGHILNWNKGAEKIKGYSEVEIIGKRFSLFYLPEDQEKKVPDSLLKLARENGRAVHEGWRVRKNGTTFWGSIVVTAIHNDAGDLIGFSKITRDLSERKLAEDKMQQYTAELELQNRELEQFAFVASHDLQEPLRKILTFSNLIQLHPDDVEMRRKYFSKIDSSAQRMSELIRSILNHSRLSQDLKGIEKVDLNKVIEDVRSNFELLIGEKQAILRSENLPAIQGVPLQIEQLFSNLVGNSLKFSGNKPEISISCQWLSPLEVQRHPKLDANRQYINLFFEDNGIGFEQQYADQIFTIFQRLNPKTAYEGTGIGLALCQKIVNNHHGLIMAHSEPGKGATFSIILPVDGFQQELV